MSEYVDGLELLRWERRIADLTAAALKRYLPVAEAAVLPSLTAALGPIPPDPGAIATTVDTWRALLHEIVLPGIESMMAERVIGLAPEAASAAEAATVAGLAGLYDKSTRAAARAYAIPAIREWMETYLAAVENRMVRTPDTVFRLIASALDEGTTAGDGVDVLRDRVQEVLDYTRNSDWRGRAELVARTETTGAYNAAGLESARLESTASGIEMYKVWVSSIDGRTRRTHFAADGQRVPLDQPFQVGKADLMHPGDPRGRVEETANCRCTMVVVEPDEPLPSEDDRHTERGETNATVRNRRGSQRDEIDRRAADGVTRARDDDEGRGSVRASAMGDTMTRTWTGRLAPIGEPSGDGRIFKPGGTFGFRTFPLPLMFQRQTSDGHDASVIIGAIRSGEIREDGIYGEGVLFTSADAAEAATLLEEGVIRPSIDWCDQEWELADKDGNPVDPETIDPETIDEVMFQITAGNLMGATLVSKPAFDGTDVTLAEEGAAEAPEEEASVTDDLTEDDVREALVASGGGLAPTFDRAMFENPGLTEPTGVHVTPEGRVVGHVATWNECHIGVGNACVMAPRSKTNYALFHVSEVDTTDGPLAVGRLTVGGGHAHPKAGVVPAREHYDNAGACWAIGRVYEDEVGIAFSGVVHPHATPRQIMDGTSAPLSGDWRRHGGNLEMVAALTVNTPGYPVVRGAADERGRDVSLVAAGMLQPKEREEQRPITEIVAEAARAAVEEYANRERRIERVATIHERIANERRAKAARIASRRVEIGAR